MARRGTPAVSVPGHLGCYRYRGRDQLLRGRSAMDSRRGTAGRSISGCCSERATSLPKAIGVGGSA